MKLPSIPSRDDLTAQARNLAGQAASGAAKAADTVSRAAVDAGRAAARSRSPARPLSICYTNRDPCVMRTVIPVLHCPHAQILSRITGAAGPGLAPSSISGVLSGARTLDRDPAGDRPHPR